MCMPKHWKVVVHHGFSATHMHLLQSTMRFTSTSKVHAKVLQNHIVHCRHLMQSKPDSQAALAVQHQMQVVATAAATV